MKFIMLAYQFMFDPSETWTKLSNFEDDLGAFFATKGLEAELMSPIGNTNNRIFLITKKPDMPPPPAPTLTIKQNLKNLRDPKTYQYPNSYGQSERKAG